MIEVIPLFNLVKCINLNYTSSQNDDDDGGALQHLTRLFIIGSYYLFFFQ
jgi:hypothetical protein